jgi:hypothetical protein
VALLHQGAGSTIDHFLRGPLEELGARIVEIDTAASPTATQGAELADCALVVVVRYLSRPWLAPLAAQIFYTVAIIQSYKLFQSVQHHRGAEPCRLFQKSA